MGHGDGVTVQGGHGDAAGERVAAKRGAVLAGLEGQHDLVAREHGRDRVDAAAERLAQDDNVRLDALVVAREHLAGACQAGLDLVRDEEDVALAAQLRSAPQVPGVGHDHAGLALNRLHHKPGDVGILQRTFCGRDRATGKRAGRRRGREDERG